jgi:hypothetical protein
VGYQRSDVLARPIAQNVTPGGAFAPLGRFEAKTPLEQQALVLGHST